MNSHSKTFSLLSGALLLSGVIYCLQGCHKEPPIGNDGADVTKVQNSNTAPEPGSAPMSAPELASKPMSGPKPTATPGVIVAAKPSPSKEKRAVAAKRGQQALTEGDYVAARRNIEVTRGAKGRRVYFSAPAATGAEVSSPAPVLGAPPAADPSTLIAQASALLHEQRPPGNLYLSSSNTASGFGDAKEALTLVDRALELLKAQPEPDDAQQKEEYLNTKRAALAVRAKALSTLASTYEPTRLGEAERAYKEYLAAESDPLKRSAAEIELARMREVTAAKQQTRRPPVTSVGASIEAPKAAATPPVKERPATKAGRKIPY